MTKVTNEQLVAEMLRLEAGLQLADSVKSLRKHFDQRLDELNQKVDHLMTLTQNEQAQLNRIAAAIQTIATETQGATQKILDLMAQHGVDQATIDGMENDVVSALSPIADRAEQLASDLANPPSPASPLNVTL